MTEKDEFGFGEEQEPAEQQESAEQQEASVAAEEELRSSLAAARGGKGSSPGRLFLMIALLLVVAGAGAYFYLGSPPTEPAPEPTPAPARQPIALPPPAETAAVKTETVAPPPPSAERAAAPAKPAPAPAPAPTSAPAAAKAAPAKTAVPKAQAPNAAEAGAYVVQAGAFALQANLEEAEAIVRRLGYEPRVRTVQRMAPMTRLRVGVFPAAEAQARLQKLAAAAPDAFILKRGGEAVVYAGSFLSLDRARRAADRLYAEGIPVEEEAVEAEVTLSLLSFGSFADRSSARETADLARQAGLEVFVSKKP